MNDSITKQVHGLGKITGSFWQDRPTLVTGATGLLGGWLVPRLLNAGASVICLVRDWIPQSQLLCPSICDHITVVRGDICDQVLQERILGEYEIDTVFHLAAQAIVPIANRNPISTFESNIKGTWCLLEASRRSPAVKQIVLASSDKAYGDHDALPYSETTPLQGRHPYDVSKSCADLIAQTYAQTYKLPICITRCANFYGGGDVNWNRIIPGTIRSVLRGDRPVIRSDGSFIRDYFYAEDGAAAYMLLAEAMAKQSGIKGEAFNFSNEVQITVHELVRQILSLMESPLNADILNLADNEIKHQYLSAQKARQILGWTPLFNIESGLRKTISWYRDYFNEKT